MTKNVMATEVEDGGWGILPGHSSNTVDTMLAVKALINNSQYHNTETMNRALQYLIYKQNHDDSWSNMKDVIKKYFIELD